MVVVKPENEINSMGSWRTTSVTINPNIGRQKIVVVDDIKVTKISFVTFHNKKMEVLKDYVVQRVEGNVFVFLTIKVPVTVINLVTDVSMKKKSSYC